MTSSRPLHGSESGSRRHLQGACQPVPVALAGGRLAGLSSGHAEAPVWLALHGWLDNAASFSRLAPLLCQALGIRLVALDFRGHGQSCHLGDPPCSPGRQAFATPGYALWDYCHDVLDALEGLMLDRAVLIGHSMGAAVASLLAAALPERVERLVLLDGLGPLTTPVSDTAEQLRRGLLAHRRERRGERFYASLEDAVAARVAGAATAIDEDTARPLVIRNLCDARRNDGTSGYRLRSDPRLLGASPVRLTPEQAQAVLAAVRCDVQLIEAKAGILARRLSHQDAIGQVAHLTRCVLGGGHHLHLEADRVASVANAIAEHAGTRYP